MIRRLELNYALGEGWLSPWLDGLREGRAVASSCSTCDDVQFPPLRVCPKCHTPSDLWRELSGGATILFRTEGTDGAFAMVHFDGASSSSIVRAEAVPPETQRAALTPCRQDPPVPTLIPEPET